MEAMQWFTIIVVAQVFYACGITILTHSIPTDDLDLVTSYSDLTNEINPTLISDKIQSNMQSQTNIPLIEVGALVFYTGNLILDLLLNFATATPQMILLFINGVTRLISLDAVVTGQVQIFVTAIVGVLYFIGIIQLLGSIRSGNKIG